MEKVAYLGWSNCYRIANRAVDLIVTGDVGPRIIRFGLAGGENEFAEFAGQAGKIGGDEWRIYGGHRLWHAPEDRPRTYWPDNSPVHVEGDALSIRVRQPAEPTTGIAKEMDITLSPDRAEATVVHRLINEGVWPVPLAPWALSVMAPGGVGIVPLPPKGSHEAQLAPVASLALWAYTDLSDPRWTLGSKFLLLRQDRSAASPQKIGLGPHTPWIAYARDGRAFVKRIIQCNCGDYPDFGSAVEMFTDRDMLEIETLGPLTALSPGAATEHAEHWSLLENVPTPTDDAEVAKSLLPRL